MHSTFSESVRARPFMYVPENNAHIELLRAVLDNAAHEVTQGFGTKISVRLLDTQTVSVTDDGRGIPVDIVPQRGHRSMLQVVFEDEPGNSGFAPRAPHASVVCALSNEVLVETTRAGRRYSARFVRGRLDVANYELGATEAKGTTVTLRPDSTLLGDFAFNRKDVVTCLEQFRRQSPTLQIDF